MTEHGSYTICLDLRVPRLPTAGTLQSLLRFTLPDMAQAKRLHRTSVYLNSDGRVVGRAIGTGGEVEGSKAAVKAGIWAIVTIVVEPSQGTITTYVNHYLCHISQFLDKDDLKLQHKLVVLGGGKKAHAKGGDIRRIVVYNQALSLEAVTSISAQLLTENPGVGKRVAKLQALIRGDLYRTKIEKEKEAEKAAEEALKAAATAALEGTEGGSEGTKEEGDAKVEEGMEGSDEEKAAAETVEGESTTTAAGAAVGAGDEPTTAAKDGGGEEGEDKKV